MSEERKGRLAVACAWWCVLGTLTLALGALAPEGFFRETEGLALGCTELSVLAFLVAGGAALGRWIPRWARMMTTSAALLAFGASWGSFWYTGHFLDQESMGFLLGDLRCILGYAAGLNGGLFLGVAGILVAGALIAVRFLPRWISRMGPRARGGLIRVSIAAASACTVAAAGATLVQARTGEYRGRRDFATGPSVRILSDLLERPNGPRGDPSPVERRPIGPVPAGESAHRWNVLVVLVDSLRADQLRRFGGERDVMPILDSLDAIAFTDCLTTATHTDYAAPSALSSQYPLRSRTSYTCPERPPYPRVLLPDVLKSAGWRTAIFSSQDEHWRSMANYLDTGTLDEYFHAGRDPLRRASRPRSEHPEGTLDDGVTIAEARRFIDGGTGPFFLCLNLQNAHVPYHVPDGFPRPFGPAHRDFPLSFGWYPKAKSAIVKDLYADSLAYIDQELGILVDHLRERGEWDRTMLVVTADHGEAFYERGVAAHGGAIVPEVARVPLLFRIPGVAPREDARPAQILDIPPTVCHALGLPPHPGFQGLDLLAEGPRTPRSRFIVAQTPFARQYAIDRGGRRLVYDAHRHGYTGSDPELESRLSSWYRAQVEYYEDPLRQATEYPPGPE